MQKLNCWKTKMEKKKSSRYHYLDDNHRNWLILNDIKAGCFAFGIQWNTILVRTNRWHNTKFVSAFYKIFRTYLCSWFDFYQPNRTVTSVLDDTFRFISYFLRIFYFQVFLVRKIFGADSGTLYAMKVLKKATLKGMCSVIW